MGKRRTSNISALAIKAGKPQVFTRKGKAYYWSPQDGEVCVEIRRDTPAEFYLWHCGREEPFRVIRRGDALFEETGRLYAGEAPEIGWVVRMVGTPLHIYYRDGSVRAWDFKRGEIPVHVSPSDRYLLIEGSRASPGKRRIRIGPDVHGAQLQRALRQQYRFMTKGELKKRLLAF